MSGEPPTAYALDKNYPNPFNPATLIRYQVPVAGPVRLAVFDILGREVAVLLDEQKQPGTYQVEFHASQMASEAYICRLKAGKNTECRRMLLLK